MNAVERAILREHYKLRKLAKIWRAIARRHLSCALRQIVLEYHNEETDP